MKKLVLMLALSLSLLLPVNAQEEVPTVWLPQIEVTGVAYVEDKPSLTNKKIPKAACILNDRIYYRDQHIEVKDGKLLGVIVPGGKVKADKDSLLFINDIYKDTVEVVYKGEKFKLKLKKRTTWGLRGAK